jgi:uncharacterized protein (TIGR02466 family)
MDNTPIHLWPPLIWKFEYKFDLTILYPLIDDLLSHWAVSKDSSLQEDGDAISSVKVGVFDNQLQPHNSPLLQDYNTWLQEKIAFVWEENKFMSNASTVNKSWINIHRKTGRTLEHMHSGSDLVVSAYLKCPKNSGNIEFRDPLEYHKTSFQCRPENNLWKEVQVSTNDILIFPGWLNHRTQENKTNEDRIVLTYNVNGI